MGAISTISSKGQVTVPVEVRRRLGVKEGDRIEFVFDGTDTVVRPVRAEGKSFSRWIGTAKGFESEASVHGWVAEMRDDEVEG